MIALNASIKKQLRPMHPTMLSKVAASHWNETVANITRCNLLCSIVWWEYLPPALGYIIHRKLCRMPSNNCICPNPVMNLDPWMEIGWSLQMNVSVATEVMQNCYFFYHKLFSKAFCDCHHSIHLIPCPHIETHHVCHSHGMHIYLGWEKVTVSTM